MISDNDALLVAGEVLAGFLKENLPQERRWHVHVAPTLRDQPNSAERPLEQLDLSTLLQVFMGNKEYLHKVGVFRTGLPFHLALCVRHMRNARAHRAYSSVLTADERLFDLHALRRFTMLIDNRAVRPGLAEDLIRALDERILETTRECLGGTAADKEDLEDNTPAEPHATPELAPLIQASERTRAELEALQVKLREVAERLVEVARASAHPVDATAALVLPVENHVDERLGSIDWKLDQLLARFNQTIVEPGVDADPVGLPEKLSYLEAKAALRTCRARLSDELPDTDPVRQLLRQSMVDRLLNQRIENLEMFETHIPEVMRRDTDQRQLEALPQVFDIIKRLR